MWKLDAAMAPSRAFIETIRGWLIDLDHLEATGAATPDTCEVLVELHELLDKLYRTMENRARKNMQCPSQQGPQVSSGSIFHAIHGKTLIGTNQRRHRQGRP